MGSREVSLRSWRANAHGIRLENMEIDIVLLARFEDEQMRDLAEFFLNGDTRPVFVDDVDEQHQAAFVSFEDIEIPESLVKYKDLDLSVTWFAGLEFELNHLNLVCASLFECGCSALSGIVLNDGYPAYRFQRSLESNKLITTYIDEDSEEYDQILDIADQEDNDLVSMIEGRFVKCCSR